MSDLPQKIIYLEKPQLAVVKLEISPYTRGKVCSRTGMYSLAEAYIEYENMEFQPGDKIIILASQGILMLIGPCGAKSLVVRKKPGGFFGFKR